VRSFHSDDRETIARVLIVRESWLDPMPSVETTRRREIPDDPAAYRLRPSVERHANTGWYEWTFRELLRYLFGIVILGLFIFVPLQMELSWLPSDAPPIFDVWVVILFAVLAWIAIGTIGLLAYRAIWGDGRWVDKIVARHRTAAL